jgi:hypothetical protein
VSPSPPPSSSLKKNIYFPWRINATRILRKEFLQIVYRDGWILSPYFFF